ncbi:hypothetical protein [Streptosporangium sp. NBC_01469]|uniref:hypothetical protein n=1 Tax=Streptosporangium sp. NBC_01469 TaxID=2903898 RepID=UPI002E2CA2B3|nr:hypothetical protein [Streptosporangium sp. NBC_01469]
MSAAVWSWVAAAVSIAGLWVGGINPRAGWIYGIGSQGVWAAYGLVTDQPGMIALSAAFVILYSRNLWRWRGTHFKPVAQAERGETP